MAISGYDHVAITVADLERTCSFYRDLFGALVEGPHILSGKQAVSRLVIGGAAMSVHQSGNGLDLVARRPTPGAADLCFRWEGGIEKATALLAARDIDIVEGPAERTACDGRRGQSVYFRDPDGNLIELLSL